VWSNAYQSLLWACHTLLCSLSQTWMFSKPDTGFVEHLSRTRVTQQSVTKIISLTFISLVTPKARSKHEPLFNKSPYPSLKTAHWPWWGNMSKINTLRFVNLILPKSRAKHQLSTNRPQGQSYKTFYGRNLRIFVLSQRCLWVRPEPTLVKHLSGAQRVGSLPYPQTASTASWSAAHSTARTSTYRSTRTSRGRTSRGHGSRTIKS
jgi:hypothetical protein